MRTSQDFKKHLASMRPNLYMQGQKVTRDDPRFDPGITLMSLTFDLRTDPDFADLLTATSHLTGKPINRFCHVHQDSEDLRRRHELTRKFQTYTGHCIQRCGGADTLNALSVVTYNIDQAKGTEYNKRFLKYLEYFQENDFVAPITQTDPKGDRSLRPHQQWDADQYLRVVEKKSDGIVVRGAKFHNSMAPYGEQLLVAPTRALTKEEADWAVAFAVPADAEGVKMVCTYERGRPRAHLDAFYSQFGSAESTTIFDNVFVPWENVFMCGETEWGPEIARLTSLYHRFNYTACKPAAIDVVMGASALAAEYNGIEKATHVQGKLADLIAVAELVYGAGIAAATLAKKAPSGTMVPDAVLVNVARYLAGVNIYKEYETLADLAGGLAATLPYEEDFYNPETGELLNKYIMRKKGVSAENIHRLWRFIQEEVSGAGTGRAQVGGLHGGGSPIMEQIALRFSYDIESKKALVKRLAGIKD